MRRYRLTQTRNSSVSFAITRAPAHTHTRTCTQWVLITVLKVICQCQVHLITLLREVILLTDSEILKRAAADVGRSFMEDDFKPTAVMIITWINVTFYGRTSNLVRITRVYQVLYKHNTVKPKSMPDSTLSEIGLYTKA